MACPCELRTESTQSPDMLSNSAWKYSESSCSVFAFSSFSYSDTIPSLSTSTSPLFITTRMAPKTSSPWPFDRVVPIGEGNSDVKKRWPGNFATVSRLDGQIPPYECMFKFERDGPVDKRLQDFLRSRGFPHWFTVAVGTKGSYREYDIISFLRKHLEPW